MLLELNFSAVVQAEKIIQEMKDKIDACRSLEDRAVAHLEVSRELSKSLRDNGLEEKGFSGYRSALSEIWELESTPVDVNGISSKLEDAQRELSILDKEHEELKVEKKAVEEKLEMIVQSNKELLLKNEELRKINQELDNVSNH